MKRLSLAAKSDGEGAFFSWQLNLRRGRPRECDGALRAELSRAQTVAADVLRAIGLREQGTALIAATTDMRARAYTTLLRVYDSARRALSYLRWQEQDTDSIAPSLYAGRGTGRKKASPDIKDPPKPPVATPGAPVGTAPNSSATNPAARASQQPVNNAAGSGDEPFLS